MSDLSMLYCCNPFNLEKHTKKLCKRTVSQRMVEKMPSLELGKKICESCRIRIYKLPYKLEKTVVESSSSSDSVMQPSTSTKEHESVEESNESEVALEAFNESLNILGESPIVRKKIKQKKYPKEKLQKISSAVKRKLLHLKGMETEEVNICTTCHDESEVINQLKEKFKLCSNRAEKIQILTVLPKSWPLCKIEEEFNVSNYMARKAKKLVEEKGIMSLPNPKLGKALADEMITLVTNFYESDEISRLMPGKKDFISVQQEGSRVHLQKRLILGNLKEVFQLFKQKHETLKIGFSKFAELRPRHCVLAGGSGTHSVCVCLIHQNVKLMLIGGSISEVTKFDKTQLKTYKDCLQIMVCSDAQPNCFLGICNNCHGPDPIQEQISNAMYDHLIDSVTYKQWVSTDRSTLETVEKTADEYTELLVEKLEKLKLHSFIASQQASFLEHIKSNLQSGEFLVISDFSENYSFLLQDAVQSFHWNNDQSTIYPFVIYFHDNQSNIQHLTLVIISECLNHDTTAVHLFQRKLIEFLVTHFHNTPNKIYYFSDRAVTHYKNRKNFSNLCYHKEDFYVDAEWHFFATAHGKGPCDGVGGTVKRLAARASLQRPYEQQIMTPRQLFEWAKENISKMTFMYTTNKDYNEEKEILRIRFENCRQIPGTQKIYAAIPLSKEILATKIYSFATDLKKEKTTIAVGELEIEEIRGFITCIYNSQWWLGCVLETCDVKAEVKLSFLHPAGPSRSFSYPRKSDILWLPFSDILTKVDPNCPTGRFYTLSVVESEAATSKLRARKINF